MKIAIHHSNGTFSEDWIKYCKENNIDFKIVNAYSTDIIRNLEDCDAFMWHHHHGEIKDILFAKQLLASIQASGKVVFPDTNSGRTALFWERIDLSRSSWDCLSP